MPGKLATNLVYVLCGEGLPTLKKLLVLLSHNWRSFLQPFHKLLVTNVLWPPAYTFTGLCPVNSLFCLPAILSTYLHD